MGTTAKTVLLFRRKLHSSAATWCRWAIKKKNLVATSNIVHKTAADEESTLISSFKERSDLFESVKPLLPYTRIPEPPQVDSPTPSGWIGPTGHLGDRYFVGRSKNHMLPVYEEVKSDINRKYTRVGKVEGDIWKLEEDLKEYLSQYIKGHIYTQVNEVTRSIRVKGTHAQHVAQFLLQKGF